MLNLKYFLIVLVVALSMSTSYVAIAAYCYDPYYNVYYYCGGYDYYPRPDGNLKYDFPIPPRPHEYRNHHQYDTSGDYGQ